MTIPLTITFHGMSPSAWIEKEIRGRVAKLGRYSRHVMSCRAVFDVPHRHHETGNRFSLRIDLRVTGDEIAVTRASNVHGSRQDMGAREWAKQFEVESVRKDVRVVVRDAFEVARRRLQDYARKQRLEVKSHSRRRSAAA
jgi:hypothetical protein